MRELRFVQVTEDGSKLLLRTADEGAADSASSTEEFVLPIDNRLRLASRGDRTGLGQLEIEMESPLRPREIQARIRSGESAEEVAAAAGVSVARVLRFAYPVLQEREQVTFEARRALIRRSRSAPTLGDQVEERLTKQGVQMSSTQWDAHRREDGTWWVTLTWGNGRKTGRAQWTFELASRAITPADDGAAELQAEAPKRRLQPPASLLPAEESPIAAEPPRRRRPAPANLTELPIEDEPTEEPTVDELPVDKLPVQVDELPTEEVPPIAAVPEETPEEKPRRTSRSQSGRSKSRKAKVPAWDDIMFGSRRNS